MDQQAQAVIAAALFKAALIEFGHQLDQDTFDRCQEAARWRIRVMSLLRDRKLSVASLSDPVWASTVLDALVCRVLNESAFIQDGSPLYWYSSYCDLVCELASVMQNAVLNGRLTLRNHLTRAALRGDDIGCWCDVDLAGRYRGSPFIPDCADWIDEPSGWPDAELMPPGALRAGEAEAWAVAEGLTEPGELLHLLGLQPQDAASILADDGGDVQPAPAPEEQASWTPERLWARHQELSKDGKGKHTQRLVAESGISERGIRRLIAPFRPQKAGHFDGLCTASNGSPKSARR